MTKGQRVAGIVFTGFIAVVGLVLLIFVPLGEGPDRGLLGVLGAEGKMLGLVALVASLIMMGIFAFSQRGAK